MRKFIKLFIFVCLLTVFTCPIFADAKNMFPIYVSYGISDIVYSDRNVRYEISNDNVKNLKDGSIISVINTVGIEGLKTTFKVSTSTNYHKVEWSTSNEIKESKDSYGYYSTLSVYPNKGDIYYASVTNGVNTYKIKFAITKVVSLSENHISPCFKTASTLNGKIKSYENYVEKTIEQYRASKIEYRDYNESSFIFKPNSKGYLEFDDDKDSLQYEPCYDIGYLKRVNGNVQTDPGKIIVDADSKVVLVVGAVDGAKYEWSQRGTVQNFGDICFNYITPKKTGYVYCTISYGNISVEVPFFIKVNNYLKAFVWKWNSDEKGDTYQFNICKGSPVQICCPITGIDINGLTVKEKKFYGKDFKYEFSANNGTDTLNIQYLYINYTPTYSKTSIFNVKDRFGNTTQIKILPTLTDHNYKYIETVKKPTVLKTGIKKYQCADCEQIIEKTVPKLKSTLIIPKTYKLKIGNKDRISVTMTKGDYITSVTAKNNKSIVKLFRKSDCFWVKGLKTGTVEVTVKTKAGNIAKCKVTVIKNTGNTNHTNTNNTNTNNSNSNNANNSNNHIDL